jgi:glycosyltransferase involved in cell wall biosynthesis
MTGRRIVIINDVSVARGGATGLALMSAEDFARAGHHVTWICGDAGENPMFAERGIEVVALGGRRLLDQSGLKTLATGLRNTAARDMVARFVTDHDTLETVYHVHGWAQILSPDLFAGLAPVAARTFVHAHDMFLACPNGVYMDYRRGEPCGRVPLSLDCLTTQCDKRNYGHKLWRVLRTSALRRHLGDGTAWAGILVLHPEMVSRLTRAGYRADAIRVVRNPAIPFSATRIRAEDNRALVYVGRLEPDKGVLALAEAARRTGVPLTLVGDGPLRPALEAMGGDITITGWTERDRIGAHVATARALVMPSRHPEPFALVIAEAAASGLPVLVSDTALMSAEVVQHGLGFAFDPADPARFDAALTRMMSLPDEDVRRMSEAGFGGAVRLGLERSAWIEALLGEYDRVPTAPHLTAAVR